MIVQVMETFIILLNLQNIKTFVLLLLLFYVESTTQYDPRVEMIQNDATCLDEFPNCNLVIKANLCGYAYYNEHCCQSCRLVSNDLF